MGNPIISPVPGTAEGGRSWDVHFECQWMDLIWYRRMNWINFTFIELSWEWERCMGNAHEVVVGLMGFTFRWSANFRPSDHLNRIIARADQIRTQLRDEREGGAT